MQSIKQRLPLLILGLFLAAVLTLAILATGLAGAKDANSTPTKYIKFEPSVYDPTSGDDVKILWNFQLQHTASIKIKNSRGELVRTLVGARTYPGGYVQNSETWDGTDDSGSIVPDGVYEVVVRPLPGQPDYSMYPSISSLIVSSNPTGGINIAPNLEGEGPYGDETKDTFVVYGPLDEENIVEVRVNVDGDIRVANLSGSTWTLDIQLREFDRVKISAKKYVEEERSRLTPDGGTEIYYEIEERNISGELDLLKYIVTPQANLDNIARHFYGDSTKSRKIADDNGISDIYALEDYWRLLIHNPINDTRLEPMQLLLSLWEKLCLGLEKLFFCDSDGDPVNLATGNYIHQHTDIIVSGAFPIRFARYYNSLDSYEGRLGTNWHHNFEYRLLINRGGDVEVIFADGHREHYELDQNTFKSPEGVFNTLSRNHDDTYTLAKPDGTTYTFNRGGYLLRITDPNGNDTELTYNDLKLVQISTASGSLHLDYNRDGFIEKITDQSGRSVEYGYEDLNLTTFTGPDCETITYDYDSEHHMTALNNPRGDGSYVNQYDDLGRVIKQTDPRGGIYTFNYNEAAQTTTITDQLQRVTVNQYDDQLRMIKRTDPLGQTEHFTYDDDNNVTSYTDKKGYTYDYEYDDRGNVLQITDPLQRVTGFRYNNLNKPTLMVLPDDREYHYDYDAAGNLLATTDPLGRVTEIIYNDRGLVETIKQPDGTALSFDHDAAGNVREMVDALNNTTRFGYDQANRVKSVIDPEGATTGFAYDGNDNTTRVTDALDHSVSYNYDDNGVLKTVTDQEGHTTTYHYNGADQLERIVDPLGNVTRYQYDVRGNVTAMTDANGHRTEYAYDELDRLVAATDPEGHTTGYAYDANDNLVQQTDPRGAVTEFEYDELNRLVSVTDPLDNVTGYAYDLAGRLVTITDPLGHVTSYEYDDADRVVSVANPLGNTEQYSYDEMDRLLTHTLPGGAVWQMEYDPQGNLTGLTDPEGHRQSWRYDKNSRVTRAIDPLGRVTEYDYDSLGQLESITDALGQTQYFEYTPRGQIASVTDPNGHTTGYVYDKLMRLARVTDAAGHDTKYDYDPVGNLTAVHQYRSILLATMASLEEDAATVTMSVYGTSVTEEVYGDDEEASVTASVYGEEASITGIGDETENDDEQASVSQAVYYAPADCLNSDIYHQPTYYTYDGRNLPLTAEDALGNTVRYEYDEAGNLVRVTDQDDFVTGFAYDLNSQLTNIRYDDNRQVAFTYDPRGYMTGFTDWLGDNSFDLDPLGRITRVTDFAGRVQEYTWNATGQKQSQTYPDGSRVSYEYDQLDRLAGVTDAFGRTTSYEYNPAGELVKQLLPGGTKTKYKYDAISQITELSHIDPSGKVTGSYAYTYDPAGNKTAVSKNAFDEDELEETEGNTFAYDALNRLISVREASGEYKNYYYDTLGNRIALIEQEKEYTEAKYYQYNNLNQLTKQYDHDGDVKHYSYDNRGNLTEMRSEGKVFNTYAFDAANQLIEVTNKFGDTTSYTYDGLGNRIQAIIDLNHGAEHNNRPVFPPGPGGPPAFVEELKNKNPGPPSHGGNPKPGWDKQFNRHYMAQHYVVDYTKEYNNLLLSYGEHSQVQRYTYGLNLVSMDFLALDDHDNGWIPSGTNTVYKEQWDSLFYLHDDLGTVTKVVGINGKTSAHYNYDEFGRPLGAVKLDPNWSGPDNAIAYTGYTYDHFAELYYAQARYYLPGIGRFISQDPWAGDMTLPGTLNPYPYVLNNPLRYVDPLGLWVCEQWFEDFQRGIQQVGSGFITGVEQVNWENISASLNVAKDNFPEGAKIFVVEGFIGEENFYIITDGQWTSEDAWALTKAGGGIILLRAKVPGGKVLGQEAKALRVFNVTKQESPLWKALNTVKGMDRRTSGTGKGKQYYEWDRTHNDIEVYDNKGNHLGSMNPNTGEMYKPPVPGRKIKL